MPTKKTVAPIPAAAKKPAAKPAAKKVAKKTASKKTSTTGKSLVYADNETSFLVADGQILNSLVALRDALSTMEKSVYVSHVSGDKNDFANWVGVVLNDAGCARDLLGAKTPAAAKTVVVRHLKLYRI